MKNVFLILPIFLLTTASVFSQDQKQVGVGIGTTVNINPGTFFVQSLQTIRVPINVSNTFRVEPFLGLFGTDSEDSYEFDPGSSNENNSSSVLLGSGFYYILPQESGNFYLGASVGKYFFDSESKDIEEDGVDKDTEEGSGWVLSPVIGGEYFFSPSFSIGLEAGLSFMTGETEINQESSMYKYQNTEKESNRFSFTTLTVKYFIF